MVREPPCSISHSLLNITLEYPTHPTVFGVRIRIRVRIAIRTMIRIRVRFKLGLRLQLGLGIRVRYVCRV